MKNILLVEDNPDIQTQMKWALSKEYAVVQAVNRQDAIKLLKKNKPAVVTLDLGLPPDEDGAGEGLLCLNEILEYAPYTKVIVVTGNNERENALKAVQSGAYDYFQKPADMDDLKVIIQRAFHLADIESENQKLHTILEKEVGFGGMIGQSPGMLSVFETIRKVASTEVSVLITGESGTGKELVARALHEKSNRKDGPFIPINCGAIPDNLLESELFGHEKGAFTSADSQQKGKFEYADKGTLFLDEIGEMSTMLQAKLLRFLEERVMQRVGGRKDIEVDTRVIAATNIDLDKAILEKTFREDLFYRINGIPIILPPLRDRGDDIILIAKAFLEKYKVMFNKNIKGFSRSALDAIIDYSWPGNVRELENKLQKAVITTDTNMIKANNLGLAGQAVMESLSVEPGNSNERISLKEARKRVEIEIIESAIERHKGNIKKASEELGVSRPTLYDLLDKYKLSAKDSEK